MKRKLPAPCSKLLLLSAMILAALVLPARETITPASLGPGSRIALVTPASAVDSCVIDSAVVRLAARGYVPVVMPHVYGQEHGSYAACDTARAADLMEAFICDTIDAILCTRGGYGCVHLLPLLDASAIHSHPKWLVGYSDISDLHAYLTTQACVASVHGPMCGHLAQEADTVDATVHLFTLLEGGLPMAYRLPPHPYNNPGRAEGMLVGGNLLTINGLSETPCDVLNIGDTDDTLLFIEDVGEKIYAIERVLMRMHQSGALGKVKGLIVGQFTGYRESEDFVTMEDMIHHWLTEWGYCGGERDIPVVFDFPTGHVTENYPMVCGARAVLEVTAEGATLTFLPGADS